MSRQPPSKKPKKPAKGKGVDSETCLQKHAKQWLDKTGIWNYLLIFHVANERIGSAGMAVHFKQMGVLPGVADWLVFPQNFPYSLRQIAIEMKTDTGPQTTNQEKFQKRWEAAGHLYFIVRTLDEFQAIVKPLVPEQLWRQAA